MKAPTLPESGFSRWLTQLARSWEQTMEGRSPRERSFIVWGGAAALVTVLIFAVWLPLQESRVRLARLVAAERKHVAVLQLAKSEMQSLVAASSSQPSGQPSEAPARSTALRAVIEASARAQLRPGLLEVRQDGESGVAVKIAKVNMAKLLSWIDDTAKGQRIRLDTATLRLDNGALTGELHFLVPDQ